MEGFFWDLQDISRHDIYKDNILLPKKISLWHFWLFYILSMYTKVILSQFACSSIFKLNFHPALCILPWIPMHSRGQKWVMGARIGELTESLSIRCDAFLHSGPRMPKARGQQVWIFGTPQWKIYLILWSPYSETHHLTNSSHQIHLLCIIQYVT